MQAVSPRGSTSRPLHEAAVATVLAELRAQGVAGVLLHGSVVRGSARPDSDIDVIVVVPTPADVRWPQSVGGIKVEIIARTVEDWLERFNRPQPRWLYAFLEGQVLHDPQSELEDLIAAARARYETYRPPAEVLERLIGWWEHVAPKHRDALESGDDLRIGLSAAFYPEVFETLYAVNGRPLPPGGPWLTLLPGLSVPEGHMALLERWLTSGSPRDRLAGQIELIDAMLPILRTLRDPAPIRIETERIRMRPFAAGDEDLLVELDADPEVMRYLTGGTPTPRETIRNEILPRFVRRDDDVPMLGFWAAHEKPTGAFIGWFSLRPHPEGPSDVVELGFRLRRASWGKGYGTEVARALIATAFGDLGVRRVVATTYEHNLASRRVLEKAGLRLARKFRFTPGSADTYHAASSEPWDGDDLLYELDRRNWRRGRATRGGERRKDA